MKNSKSIYFLLGLVISSILVSCSTEPAETVRGKVTSLIVLDEIGQKIIRQGLESDRRTLVFDFSELRNPDHKMTGLPYPKQNGAYSIPAGSPGVIGIELNDGKLIYFQRDKEYEFTGALRDLKKANIRPLKSGEKEYRLFAVKKVIMLESK